MQEGDIYFYNAWHYDPQLGRFMQADTIVPTQQGTQAWDRYAYLNNNPVNGTDPTGHCIDGISTAACIVIGGIIVGAIWSYIKQVDRNISAGLSIGEALITDISGQDIFADGAKGGLSAALVVAAAPVVVPLFTAAVADGDPTNEVAAVKNTIETGTNTVYQYVKDGIPKYIGITNDFARRAQEHLAKGWEITKIQGLDTLSRFDARAMEQALIEQYKLVNLLNSISSSNPIYQSAIE